MIPHRERTDMKTLHLELGGDSYDIYIERGLHRRASDIFDLNRKVLIVTDEGVPAVYAEAVASRCGEAEIVTLPQGEESKSLENFELLLKKMLTNRFDRHDCVVAVGGGVVGDLAGFASACYMRGIDFYNIPTTVLSQVDSSVGGKTAVNFCGVKNIVGAFHQPKGVIIDTELLKTLPERQISNGLAEAVKMALTFDSALFEKIEAGIDEGSLDDIIVRSLELKKKVVELDEKENGLRKVLNFGHTLGHGVESLGIGLYHGECVALGMLPMCSYNVKARLIHVLDSLSLPTALDFDREKAFEAIKHDKKSSDNMITAVKVDEIGSYRLENVPLPELKKLLYTI